jgi:hypothetical protein
MNFPCASWTIAKKNTERRLTMLIVTDAIDFISISGYTRRKIFGTYDCYESTPREMKGRGEEAV